MGFGGMLDQMKIRIIQTQVELELGLNLAKIQHSLRDTFVGTPFSYNVPIDTAFLKLDILNPQSLRSLLESFVFFLNLPFNIYQIIH